MYARPDRYITTEPVELAKQSLREIELLDKLFKGTDEIDAKYSIGKYWPDPVALPKLFEELGFKNIMVDGMSIPVAIDDVRNNEEDRFAIITADRELIFEAINKGLYLNKNALSDTEIIELKKMVLERFEQRISYIRNGEKIWDYSIFIIQIISGEV